MKLHSLKISGFKRIRDTELLFGDATFLIGSNNSGKSTTLKAIEWLLSGKKTALLHKSA
jgi:putative ATP-dependent endonuclease of OLD family